MSQLIDDVIDDDLPLTMTMDNRISKTQRGWEAAFANKFTTISLSIQVLIDPPRNRQPVCQLIKRDDDNDGDGDGDRGSSDSGGSAGNRK